MMSIVTVFRVLKFSVCFLKKVVEGCFGMVGGVCDWLSGWSEGVVFLV
jgi:hypothetical protein